MAIPVGHALAADVNVVTLDPSAQRDELKQTIATGNVQEMERLCADPNVDVAALNIPRSPVGLVTDGPTLLSLCAGKPELARILMAAGARPDAGNREERTALHVAAEQGDATFLEGLLSAEGLDVDIRDCEGSTPLYHAISAYTGKFNTLKLLLDRGADANAPVDDDETPLHFLTRLFTFDGISLDTYKKCVDELLAKGAMVDGTSDRRETALCALVKAICSDGSREACVEAALYLLEKGARPDLLMKEQAPALWGKLSPLHLATNENYPIKILEAMLQVPDVNVNICFPAGISPIAYAALKGNLPAVEALYAAKARIDGEGQSLKCTPLHHAAEQGHADIVDFLIEAGAELDADLEGYDDGEHIENQELTPLALAVREGKKEAALALLNAGADFRVRPEGTPLICSAAKNSDNVELMRALLERDASLVNSKTEEDDTPLHIAVDYENPEVVRLLLSYSAEPFTPNANGDTPLHIAAKIHEWLGIGQEGIHYSGETAKGKILREFVSALEPVEVQERSEGYLSRVGTALWGAIGYNNLPPQTAALLAEDGEGNTVLDLAMVKYEEDQITGYHSFLLRPDPLLSLPEFFINSPEHYKGGNTPLHYAIFVGAKAIKRVLAACPEFLNQPNDAGEAPLLAAARAFTRNPGQIPPLAKESIGCLLQQPEIDLDFSNLEGCSALHIAAEKGDAWLVKRLLKAKADALLMSNEGTPLMVAVAKGLLYKKGPSSNRTEVLKCLLEARREQLKRDGGEDPEAFDVPLLRAFTSGNSELVRFIVENELPVHKDTRCLVDSIHEIDPKVLTSFLKRLPKHRYQEGGAHKIALRTALQSGHLEVAKELLKHEELKQHKDPDGNTPLHHACHSFSVETVELAFEACGATAMSAKNAEGKTPLHIACEKWSEAAVYVLLDKSPSIRHDPEAGYPFDCLANRTCPHSSGYKSYAKEQEWENIRRKILTRFSNYLIEESSRTDVPPLHAACLSDSSRRGRLWWCPIGRFLTEDRPDVNGKDKRGQTALHWVARFGSQVSANELLDRSAQLDVKDCNGNTPIDLIHVPIGLQGSNWQSDIAEQWTARAKQVPLLSELSVRGSATLSKEEYREMVKDPEDGREEFLRARTYLEKDGKYSYIYTQEKVNIQNSSGRTPLHWVCQNGELSDVRELLAVPGIELGLEDAGGHTPLSLARHFGHNEIVALLEEAAAEKNQLPRKLSVRGSSTIQNEEYRKEVEQAHAKFSTTLHQRCEKGEDISECLRYAPAASALDSSGRTPLHWACQKGGVDNVYKLLGISGVQLDLEDIGGHTPLTLAKHFQHDEIVALLEEAASAVHPQGGSPSAASESPVATTEDAEQALSDPLIPSDSDGENSPVASIQSDVNPVESSSGHAALSGLGVMVKAEEPAAPAPQRTVVAEDIEGSSTHLSDGEDSSNGASIWNTTLAASSDTGSSSSSSSHAALRGKVEEGESSSSSLL